MNCQGWRFRELDVTLAASTIRWTRSSGTGLSWNFRTATMVRSASKTSMLEPPVPGGCQSLAGASAADLGPVLAATVLHRDIFRAPPLQSGGVPCDRLGRRSARLMKVVLIAPV